jgi:hypothetical protein
LLGAPCLLSLLTLALACPAIARRRLFLSRGFLCRALVIMFHGAALLDQRLARR